MRGMKNFPLSFGLGPSINFLSTMIALLPFEMTSVIIFTKCGIQAVPSGRTCGFNDNQIHNDLIGLFQ